MQSFQAMQPFQIHAMAAILMAPLRYSPLGPNPTYGTTYQGFPPRQAFADSFGKILLDPRE